MVDRIKSRKFGNEALDNHNITPSELSSSESAIVEVRGKKVGKDRIGNLIRKRED